MTRTAATRLQEPDYFSPPFFATAPDLVRMQPLPSTHTGCVCVTSPLCSGSCVCACPLHHNNSFHFTLQREFYSSINIFSSCSLSRCSQTSALLFSTFHLFLSLIGIRPVSYRGLVWGKTLRFLINQLHPLCGNWKVHCYSDNEA